MSSDGGDPRAVSGCGRTRCMCARHDDRRPDADVLIAIECRTGIIRDKCKSRNIYRIVYYVFKRTICADSIIIGNAQQQF